MIMMSPATRTLIEDIAIRHYTTLDKILAHSQPKLLLRARVEIATELLARGFNVNQIAAAMNRNHTTASFYLGHVKAKPPAIKPLRPVPVKKPPPPPERQLIRYAGWEPALLRRRERRAP
jgi:DNA-binding CsgD family transcriptional regulator